MKQPLILLSLISLIIVGSCKKKCAVSSEDVPISSLANSLMPYHANSKLTLTIPEFNATTTFSPIKAETVSNPHSTYGTDNCEHIRNLQTKVFTMQSPDDDSGLMIAIGHAVIARDNGGTVQIIVDPAKEFLCVGYKDDLFVTDIANLGSPYEYDTLTVQGTLYYNVSTFKSDLDSNMEHTCFYNAEYGVLKLGLGSNFYYQLKKLQ